MGLFRVIYRILRFLFFITIILFILYSFLGFVVIPQIGKHILVSKISEATGHDIKIVSVRFNPFTFVASLNQVQLSCKNQQKRLIGFEALVLKFQISSLLGPELIINEINIQKPFANLVLRPNGQWNIADLSRKEKKPPKVQKLSPPPKPSKKVLPAIYIKKVLLSHGQIGVKDLRRNAIFNESVLDLNMVINHIRPQSNQESYFDITAETKKGILGKLVEIKGVLKLAPLKINGHLTLNKVNLDQTGSLFKKQGKFEIQGGNGTLTAAFLFSANKGKPQFTLSKANADIRALKLRQPGATEFRVLLPTVKLSNLSYHLDKNQLRLQKISAENADITVVLNQKRKSKQKIIIKNKPAKKIKTQAKPFRLYVDQINLVHGQALLINKTHQPLSRLHFQNLKANVKNFSLNKNQISLFTAKGKVEQQSSFEISGQSTLLNFQQETKLNLALYNFNLPSINPYFKKSFGQVLEKGKMDAYLHYQIKNSQMKGENRIIIDQLTLGEESDVKGALNLPLGLIVGILRDGDGKIDIELPVGGDLKKPDFKYGNLVAQSLWKLVKKTATSPFRFFADLFGSEEKSRFVSFDPGKNVLKRKESAKLDQLKKAMEKDKDLKLDIQGTYHIIKDRLALQKALLKNQMASLGVGNTIEKQFRLYQKMYYLETKKQFKRIPGNRLQAQTRKIESLLLNRIKIHKNQLRLLAKQRARIIYTALVRKGIQATKLFVTNIKEVKSDQTDTVPVNLLLHSN